MKSCQLLLHRAFLFKLIELALLVVCSEEAWDQQRESYRDLQSLAVWGVAGATILLLTLLTVYIIDEAHYIMESISLGVYAVILLCGGLNLILKDYHKEPKFREGILGGVFMVVASVVMILDCLFLYWEKPPKKPEGGVMN